MNVYDICFVYNTNIDTSSNICRYLSSNTHICYSFPRAHWRLNSARLHRSLSGTSSPIVREEARHGFSISSLCWQRLSSWSGTLSSSSFLFLFRSFLFSFFLLFLLLKQVHANHTPEVLDKTSTFSQQLSELLAVAKATDL
jgi:hypothetical protein